MDETTKAFMQVVGMLLGVLAVTAMICFGAAAYSCSEFGNMYGAETKLLFPDTCYIKDPESGDWLDKRSFNIMKVFGKR